MCDEERLTRQRRPGWKGEVGFSFCRNHSQSTKDMFAAQPPPIYKGKVSDGRGSDLALGTRLHLPLLKKSKTITEGDLKVK